LPNPDDYLQSCGIQANIITPTLQSGGDIQTPFDRGIVLASGVIQPTQILQIMGRFRQCHEWHISAPRFSQESALSFSTLDSKKIEQWGERLGDAFGDLEIPTQKETFSWGLWESLVSEIEKSFNSEYIQHLLGLYFESVEPIEVDLSKHREPWKNLRDAVKLEDADKTIRASLKHGLKLRQEKRQARYNSEVWDLKLADLHEKYPDTFINLIDRSQQPTISIGSDIELLKEVNLYSSKRMDRLKLYLIATEWKEQYGQDLQQSMRDQFTCPQSHRFRMYGTVRLFRELNLADLVKCQKSEASDDPAAETRNSEILPNVRHFCADSPKAIALWERFKSSQIRKLFPTVESIQGFWVVVNRCLAALGYQKTSGGNARIDTQTPHKNGFYSDGRQRYSNSQSRHHTGWLVMEHSGSKLFQQIFETVMNDIRDLIQREAKDRDKWRSEPDSP